VRATNLEISIVGSDDDLDEWEPAPDPEATVQYGQPPLDVMEEEDEKIPPW